MPLVVMMMKCAASSAMNKPPETASACPALSRGSKAIRYTAMTRNISISTQWDHVGETKKCSDSIDDTECASVVTPGIAGETGVTEVAPRPAAVGPISTILSAYLDTGILP